MTEPNSLAQPMQSVAALQAFATLYHVWAKRQNPAISLHIGASEADPAAMAFQVAGAKDLTEAQIGEFMALLEGVDRLIYLKRLVADLQALGVDNGKIQYFVLEADSLFGQLFNDPTPST